MRACTVSPTTLSFVLLCLGVGAGVVQAELRCEPTELRVGKVFGGRPLTVSFTLSAAGTLPIEIVEVERSCGCLEPQLTDRVLAPGKEAALKFALRTLGHRDGPHTWRATVRYRAGDRTFTLPLAVHVDIVNEVVVQPAVVALHVSDRLTQKITVEDRRAHPLRITRIEPGLPGLAIRSQQMEKGSWTLELIATAESLPPGRTETMVTVHTSDLDYPRLSIPLTLVRVDRARVSAVPEIVRLGRMGPRSLLVRLRPRDDRPVKVRQAVPSHPDLACTWAAGPGPLATVRVRLKENARTGVRDGVREEIRVELEGETLILPVEID